MYGFSDFHKSFLLKNAFNEIVKYQTLKFSTEQWWYVILSVGLLFIIIIFIYYRENCKFFWFFNSFKANIPISLQHPFSSLCLISFRLAKSISLVTSVKRGLPTKEFIFHTCGYFTFAANWYACILTWLKHIYF